MSACTLYIPQIPNQKLLEREARFLAAKNRELYHDLLQLWKEEDKAAFFEKLEESGKTFEWFISW